MKKEMQWAVIKAGEAVGSRDILRRAARSKVFGCKKWHFGVFITRQIDQTKTVSAFDITVRIPFRSGESGNRHWGWSKHTQHLGQLPLAGRLLQI